MVALGNDERDNYLEDASPMRGGSRCGGTVSESILPTGRPVFSVQQTHVDGQVVLALVGDLDCTTVPDLAAATQSACAEGFRTLVLDLRSLRFIDSSGLNEFVATMKRQRALGGNVLLRSPTEQTLRVLQIVGLDTVFDII